MPITKFTEWLGFRKPIQTPKDAETKFLLKYDDLVIGTLSVSGGKWKFEYSEELRFGKRTITNPFEFESVA